MKIQERLEGSLIIIVASAITTGIAITHDGCTGTGFDRRGRRTGRANGNTAVIAVGHTKLMPDFVTQKLIVEHRSILRTAVNGAIRGVTNVGGAVCLSVVNANRGRYGNPFARPAGITQHVAHVVVRCTNFLVDINLILVRRFTRIIIGIRIGVGVYVTVGTAIDNFRIADERERHTEFGSVNGVHPVDVTNYRAESGRDGAAPLFGEFTGGGYRQPKRAECGAGVVERGTFAPAPGANTGNGRINAATFTERAGCFYVFRLLRISGKIGQVYPACAVGRRFGVVNGIAPHAQNDGVETISRETEPDGVVFVGRTGARIRFDFGVAGGNGRGQNRRLRHGERFHRPVWQRDVER